MGGGRGLNFPQCGKKFSTLWKKSKKVFHSVEKSAKSFPHCGKSRLSGTGVFSTLWKTAAVWLGLAAGAAAVQNATMQGLTPNREAAIERLGIWCEFMPYAEVEGHLPVLAEYECDLILHVERGSFGDPDFPKLLHAAERAGVGVDAWLLLPYEEHL